MGGHPCVVAGFTRVFAQRSAGRAPQTKRMLRSWNAKMDAKNEWIVGLDSPIPTILNRPQKWS